MDHLPSESQSGTIIPTISADIAVFKIVSNLFLTLFWDNQVTPRT